MFGILRKKRKRRSAGFHEWDLSTPLINWGGGESWTIGDSFQGMQIFGGTGSGKSTTTVRETCTAQLKAGYGGLFLTAKREDRALYEKYVREAGRESDLLVFSPDNMLRFNFIDDEMRRSENGAGLVENLTAMIMTVTELGDHHHSGGGGGVENENYFRQGAAKLCRHSILTLMLAKGCVTMTDLHRFITTAAHSLKEVKSEQWQGDFHHQCLVAANRAPKSPSQKADFELAIPFFLSEWAGMSSRTRTSIETTLTNATDMLCRGAARDLLSSPNPNISPELCYEGAIVIADFPVLVYYDVGRLIQVILKYCWQRAHSARDVSKNPRPTFIVADESHLLAVNSDQAFQTIVRSSRTSVIYATQSISNYLEVFGDRSEPRVHSLLGNLQTQIFHQQTDTRTIAYAQELIGRRRQLLLNGNSSDNGDWMASMSMWNGGPQNVSTGFSESYEFDLQAADFNGLAKGGPPRWQVEAILYQGGKRFKSTGKTWMPVTFRQR